MFIANLIRIIFTCVALVCGIMVALFAHADIFSLDPRATYLRVNSEASFDASAIDLSNLSFAVHAGDLLKLQELGDWQAGEPVHFTDTAKDTIAVFSSSSTLLNSFILNRVPGAIAAGIPFITVPTFFGDLQTDIPQDFLVARTVNPITSVVVRVPAGAKFLFVAAHDSHYSTNQDPDSDYKVSITPFTAVPEPSIHQLLTLGLAVSLSVFAKRRLMKRPHPPS
jgi:hypothetical protein